MGSDKKDVRRHGDGGEWRHKAQTGLPQDSVGMTVLAAKAVCCLAWLQRWFPYTQVSNCYKWCVKWERIIRFGGLRKTNWKPDLVSKYRLKCPQWSGRGRSSEIAQSDSEGRRCRIGWENAWMAVQNWGEREETDDRECKGARSHLCVLFSKPLSQEIFAVTCTDSCTQPSFLRLPSTYCSHRVLTWNSTHVNICQNTSIHKSTHSLPSVK